MSEREKALIAETVENMKHMDEQSLLLLKSNSEVLKARDAMDRTAVVDTEAAGKG